MVIDQWPAAAGEGLTTDTLRRDAYPAHPAHRRGQLHQPIQRGARHRARGLEETDHGGHDSTRRVLLSAGAQQGGRGQPVSDGAPGGRDQSPRLLWFPRRTGRSARLRSRRSGGVQAVRAGGQVEAHRPQARVPGEWRGARGCGGRAAPEAGRGEDQRDGCRRRLRGRRLLKVFGIAVTNLEDALEAALAEGAKKAEAELRERMKEVIALVERLSERAAKL